jgi:hypothetical protein
MIDTTGSALPGLLAALGNNFPAVLAGYVTGLDGVDWPARYWTDLATKCGLFRYDQTPALSLFGSGAADGADIERGAGVLSDAIIAAQNREAHGWDSYFYFSQGVLGQARQAVAGSGLKRVSFIVANWGDSRATAEAFIAANPDVAGVQWASPSSNPDTICPGTSKTLAELNVDLNVTQAGFFALHPVPPPPPANWTEEIVKELPTLAQGATGADVRSVQGLLTARNYPTAIDGIFGPNTDANVRSFQGANGLVVDGIVGPATWPKLLNV